MAESTLPQVKNIVFLMLENRSLDNILGWLYEMPLPPATGRPAPPDHVLPAGSSPHFDGLKADTFFNPAPNGTAVKVVPIPDGYYDATPQRDPFEALKQLDGFWYGVMNQLYGGQNTIAGMPKPGDGPPPMTGFLNDYKGFTSINPDPDPLYGLDVLWTYQPARAPVINSLAMQYAVSDRWFASVPSDTNPNRAYSLCGTSLGRESNLHLSAVETFDHITIFYALAHGSNKNWGLYCSDIWQQEKCYTAYTFPDIAGLPNGEIDTLATFFRRASAGTLPAFSYIEPKWTTPGIGPVKLITGTDYHPNADIDKSESFLRDVYNAVRGGPQWRETLFIVTFDEHGGNYDHVPPTWNAINPDGKNGENGFTFELYGVRVPTILISPFVRPRTVFRPQNPAGKPFDHTSCIKTILSWAGIPLTQFNFGNRMPAAQTFEYVLADRPVNEGAAIAASAPTRAAIPEAESAETVLDGIPTPIAREIVRGHDTLDAMRAEVERYRRDPGAYEAEVAARWSLP